jgi:hypothetical protein
MELLDFSSLYERGLSRETPIWSQLDRRDRGNDAFVSYIQTIEHAIQHLDRKGIVVINC